MKRFKFMNFVFFNIILISIILSGCSNPAASVTTLTKEKNTSVNINGENKSKVIATLYGYWQGLKFISPEARDYGNSSSFFNDYQTWKNNYVVSVGLPFYCMRVQRDKASNYDTVSEGIGYGMLLAVYFNDQTTFDLLYRYCRAHFIKVNGTTVPLMHWKVDSSQNNVSSFADYKVDTTKFTVWSGNTPTYYTSQQPIVPHGIVYGNLTDGTVFVTPNGSSGDVIRTVLNMNSNYYKMNLNYSDYSSATDADEDIAAALCIATKAWANSPSSYNFNYKTEAINMIKAIKQYDIDSSYFVKNGNMWGGQNGWNPSYFTPAYYINLYAKLCPEDTTFWTNVYTTMYNEMFKIVNYCNNVYNTFYPDWCNTTNNTVQKATTVSDRMFYNNGKVGEHPSMIYPQSAKWKDGTKKEDYNLQMLSYNSYYDAVRVPWRIAADYSWDYDYNHAASYSAKVIQPLYYSYNSKWNSTKGLLDGYTIKGDKWVFTDRDGFNGGEGGIYPSTAFFEMAACAGMYYPQWNTTYWSTALKRTEQMSADYNYYGNTLKMLALLFITGKFQNLLEQTYPPTTPVLLYRYYNVNNGDHFYTTDWSYYNSEGYVYEGPQCYVYKTAVMDNGATVSLHRYYNYSTGFNFYTTNWNELGGGAGGYTYMGVAANVYPKQASGTTPLYRYCNRTNASHFYTSNWSELGGGNSVWVYEGVQCYVK